MHVDGTLTFVIGFAEHLLNFVTEGVGATMSVDMIALRWAWLGRQEDGYEIRVGRGCGECICQHAGGARASPFRDTMCEKRRCGVVRVCSDGVPDAARTDLGVPSSRLAVCFV